MESTRAGGPAGGPTTTPMARECSFTGFMKCGPTQFHGTEGAVGLVRWFENMENTFEISSEVANERPWNEVKQMMTDDFCPTEEVQSEVANERPWNEVKQMMTDDFCPTEEVQRIMPPKRKSQTNPQPTLTQEAVDQIVRDGIKATIRDEQERVTTLGREVANERPWTEVKQMMTDEFCPTEEVQRLEDELRHLKLRDMNIAAYTERFNELALLCPDDVPNEKKNVELYIKGLPEIIKGETTSSRPAILNEAVRMAHALMEQKIQAKNERIAEGIKRKWEKNQGNNNNNNSHNRGNYWNNIHPNQNNNRRQNNARALTTAQNAGANQTGIAAKCNRCGRCHFDQCPPKCDNCGRMGHK
nr:hypothetical protein [Tanacetum cinerariifolium]